MMKPYLVSSVDQYGKVVKAFKPVVLIDKRCSDSTLALLHALLEGVVSDKCGTAHRALDNPYFKIAGKTGTALVANGSHGYADHIYQATFVGYFPADHPRYSCIVTIKNKPHAAHIYGASVAAPVFGEVASRLYAMSFKKPVPARSRPRVDSSLQIKAAPPRELQTLLTALHLPFSAKGALKAACADPAVSGSTVMLRPVKVSREGVPDVRGMGLKDALYLLESAGLKVKVSGKGRVVSQSLRPGQNFGDGSTIEIQLS
jgi:cell division protein FtsI (penicillin-binding protein 3)